MSFFVVMTGPNKEDVNYYDALADKEKPWYSSIGGIKDRIRYPLIDAFKWAKDGISDFGYNFFKKVDTNRKSSRIYRSKWRYWLVIPKGYNGKKLDRKTAAEYDYIESLSNWSFLVKVWEKYWLVDNKWKKITKLEYDNVVVEKVNFGTKDLLVVTKEGKKWVMNDMWEIVVPLEYNGVEVVQNEDKIFFIVTEWDKKWIMNESWEWVVRPEYNDIKAVTRYNYENEGKAEISFIVKKLDKKWVINDKWKTVIPLEYDEIVVPFHGTWNIVFIVKRWDRYWLSSFDGKIIKDTREYDNYEIISESGIGLRENSYMENRVTLTGKGVKPFTYFQYGHN